VTISLFVSLVYYAESTVCWFVVREKHCWMAADSADKSKRTGWMPDQAVARGSSCVPVSLPRASNEPRPARLCPAVALVPVCLATPRPSQIHGSAQGRLELVSMPFARETIARCFTGTCTHAHGHATGWTPATCAHRCRLSSQAPTVLALNTSLACLHLEVQKNF
jgi:hypothetical protein